MQLKSVSFQTLTKKTERFVLAKDQYTEYCSNYSWSRDGKMHKPQVLVGRSKGPIQYEAT